MTASPVIEAVRGPCGGRQLPDDRVRNLSNLRLECAGGSDHYIRRPMPFDMKAWKQAKIEGDSKRMQEIGQDQPLIKWHSQAFYDTFEVWDWEERVYGESEYHCGASYSEHKDKEGKTYRVKHIKSCWYDDPRHEERFCSNETLTYDAEFVRPSWDEWNPGMTGEPYYYILPNKYDLLPGEIEDVQFFTNYFQSTTVKPYASVNNAWNKYELSLRLRGGGQTFECRYRNPQHADLAIYTKGRTIRRTPNSFRKPVDEFGRPAQELAWSEGVEENGVQDNRPETLRLGDSSTELIEALAETSRNFNAQVEQEKFKHGEGTSADPEEVRKFESSEETGFWADTQIRLRLYKDALISHNQVAHYAYSWASKVAEWWDGSVYNMPLQNPDRSASLYQQAGPGPDSWWDWMALSLEPQTKYTIYISMFHKDVPFYKQPSSFGGDGHFSDELKVKFTTGKADSRDTFTKLKHWQRKSLWQKLTFQ